MSQYIIQDGRWCHASNPSQRLNALELNNLSKEIKKVECFTDKHNIPDDKKLLLFSVINTTNKQDQIINKILTLDDSKLALVEKRLL